MFLTLPVTQPAYHLFSLGVTSREQQVLSGCDLFLAQSFDPHALSKLEDCSFTVLKMSKAQLCSGQIKLIRLFFRVSLIVERDIPLLGFVDPWIDLFIGALNQTIEECCAHRLLSSEQQQQRPKFIGEFNWKPTNPRPL